MDGLMILGFLGSLGTTELLMVFVVVLILFGPKQLPQIAKTIGKGLRDIRRAANQLKHEVGLDELDEIYPRSRPVPPPRREVDASGSETPPTGETASGSETPPTGETASGSETPPTVEASGETASGPVPKGHESRTSGASSAQLGFKTPPTVDASEEPEIRSPKPARDPGETP
jgi:sec-independent protein translocase protein TatA